MKAKLLIVMFVGGMAMALSSCKSDFSCTCNWNDPDNGDTTFVQTYIKAEKADAEKYCTNLQEDFAEDDPDAECNLAKLN